MKVGRAMSWGAARSETEAGPLTSRSMTARRVGSERAEKVMSIWLAMLLSIGEGWGTVKPVASGKFTAVNFNYLFTMV